MADKVETIRRLSYEIPLEDGGRRAGWSLRLTREDDATLLIGLHYGDKEIPTHAVECPLDEIRDMFKELLE